MKARRLVSAALLTASVIATWLSLTLTPVVWAVDLAHPRQQRDLPPALRNQLTETLSDEAQPFLNAEDEKKSRNEAYVDLQPQFEYLPNYGPGGRLVVSAKLGGAEYIAPKSGVGKGTATGKLKYLVFTYSLVKGKWIELNKPRWETQALGPKAAKKMTEAAERAEKYKAAQERARQAQELAKERARQKEMASQPTPQKTAQPAAPTEPPAAIQH